MSCRIDAPRISGDNCQTLLSHYLTAAGCCTQALV
jgi:hypothetical protein